MSTPFLNNDDMLSACMELVDAMCAAHIDLARQRTDGAHAGRGALPATDRVEAALSGGDIETCEGWDEYVSGVLARVWLSDGLPLARLLSALDASDFEALNVLLALAPEINRKYERVLAHLTGASRETRATLGLAADLYTIARPPEPRELAALRDPCSLINRYILISDDKYAAPARPLKLRDPARDFLLGLSGLPASLAGVCSLMPDEDPGDIIAGGELIGRSVEWARSHCKRGERTGLLQLCAAAGTGRRFLLRKLAHELGATLLLIDCTALAALDAVSRRAALDDMASYCYITDALPALLRLDAAPSEQTRRVMDALACCAHVIAVCVERPLELPGDARYEPMTLVLPPYTLGEQQRFWRHFLAMRALPFEGGADITDAAGLYSLAPGLIERVLIMAEGECVSRGLPHIDADAVANAVRMLCRPRMEALTQQLALHFTWDDLQLGTEQQALLRRVVDRVRHRFTVREQWGFERKLPYGRGVSVLLYGPPGTGKTMAAQVLARELGLDAYRVDMSRVMDKYIGETEKKLSELFDAAKDSNAILFFDEADALFSRRTEVGDARDKYANAETAYLLQRMEQHDGISILATNIAQNFDEAFKRRISFMVHMPLPDTEQRRRIWRSVLPPEAPLNADISIDFFAERFELSGSSIKSVVMSAAFYAASEGTAITRQCITRAIKEEYAKNGRVLMEHELY